MNRPLKPSETLLSYATRWIGLKEISGEHDNPFIVEMFKDIGFNWIKDDETAWCSCFINWLCHKTDIERSGKLDARSWLKVGNETLYPTPGDIVIFWREDKESWKGHVAVFVGFNKAGNIFALGGNQNNEVNITEYSSSRLLGFRELNYK